MNLITDGYLNNAGEVLFSKNNPLILKMAVFATDEKITFLDIKREEGNIFQLIEKGMKYITSNIRWRVEINGIQRTEIPEIPVDAIREIVINAFAHAMYLPTPEIEINIHPGKITIFNPGTFPDGLTPNDYIEKNISSVKRNPIILDVLYRCKDVEKSGTGFKRMNALCIKEGIHWDSISTPYGFYFTFYRVTNGILHEGFTNNEEQIYQMVKNDSKVTREKLAQKIGMSTRTVQRITDKLAKNGYIARIGNNRFGYWEVLK